MIITSRVIILQFELFRTSISSVFAIDREYSSCKMGKNEVLIEWINKKKGDADSNRVNVKHLLVKDPNDITVGAIVAMKHGRKEYRGKVTNLLEWKPKATKRKFGKKVRTHVR